jgi:hypothetical protein
MSLAEKDQSPSRKSADEETGSNDGDFKSSEAKGGLSHYFVSSIKYDDVK